MRLFAAVLSVILVTASFANEGLIVSAAENETLLQTESSVSGNDAIKENVYHTVVLDTEDYYAEDAFTGEDGIQTVVLPEYKEATAVDSSEQCGDYVGWTLDEDGVMTIWGTGPMWDFSDDADFYDYHGECPWEEERDNIKKVVIESGVTRIGAFAFFECINLEEVTFSDTLEEIASFAFMRCTNLENFTLPVSLRALGQQAFAECEKLTKVVIPDYVTFLDASIFDGAIALTDVYIGGSADVFSYVYSNCIFRNCTALEEIKVSPDNIALTAIDGMLYGKDNDCLVQYPLGRMDKRVILPDVTKDIMQFGVDGAVYLEELVLPEGMLELGLRAISSCPSLKYLTIPSSVQKIGDDIGAFCYQMICLENKSEAQMVIRSDSGNAWTDAEGNTVLTLGKGKVYLHGAASGVEVDDTLTLEVGDSAIIPTEIFYGGSTGLVREDKNDLIFSSSNPKVATVSDEGKVVAKSGGTAEITIKNRYSNADHSNDFVSTCTVTVDGKINISNAKISSIAKQYYTGKAMTPAVKITYDGKTLQKNKDYTVSYKNNKNIGTGTVTIKGKGSFFGTVSKRFSIGVKKGKTYTVDNVKYKITDTKSDGKGTVTLTGITNGSKLAKMNIGNTVNIGGKKFQITAIGAKAFKGCAKLKEVVIGTNVKTIGKEAFSGDKKLAKIIIKSKKITSIGKNALKDIKSDAVIDVPSAKVKAYKKLLKSSVGYKETMKVK